MVRKTEQRSQANRKKDDELRLRVGSEFVKELDAYIEKIHESGKEATRSSLIRLAIREYIKQHPHQDGGAPSPHSRQ
jgi:metal-responsive CopG/Arc/MetJ family transcriptional regulator